MRQYQRMVSYFYRYEQGEKKKNTGYARLETRGEKCRLYVQLQETQAADAQLAFLCREASAWCRVEAGRMHQKGNGVWTRVETSCSDLMGTGISLEEAQGLLICLNEQVCYATMWTENIPDLSQEIPLYGSRPAELTTLREKTRMAEEQPVKSASWKGDDRAKGEPAETTERPTQEKAAGKKEQSGSPIEEKQTGKTPEKSEGAVKEREEPALQATDVESDRMTYGQRMLEQLPPMYPFEQKGMGPCVRMDLKDIGWLPVQYWSLAGNPFVLHGYYCYRHLIFTDLDRESYGVGVPGVYSEENRLQAEKCGFKKFLPLWEGEAAGGSFGYWVRVLV